MNIKHKSQENNIKCDCTNGFVFFNINFTKNEWMQYEKHVRSIIFTLAVLIEIKKKTFAELTK